MKIRKLATLLLFIGLLSSMLVSVHAESATYHRGDIITFGTYQQNGDGMEPIQWIVLDPESGLLLSRFVIDTLPFINESTNYLEEPGKEPELYQFLINEYKNSSIRKWLNESFYTSAFSADERYLIKETVLENDVYKENGTLSPYTTKDKVFLLSVNEASNPDYGFNGVKEADPVRAAQGTPYAISRGFYTGENSGVKDYYSNWWLRNPSGLVLNICVVRGNGKIETMMASDHPNAKSVGVRPAIKIDLSALGTTPDRRIGDPDGDNKVSSSDARIALRASVGLDQLSTWQKKAADVDHDGDITSADARIILRASVNLEQLTE